MRCLFVPFLVVWWTDDRLLLTYRSFRVIRNLLQYVDGGRMNGCSLYLFLRSSCFDRMNFGLQQFESHTSSIDIFFPVIFSSPWKYSLCKAQPPPIIAEAIHLIFFAFLPLFVAWNLIFPMRNMNVVHQLAYSASKRITELHGGWCASILSVLLVSLCTTTFKWRHSIFRRARNIETTHSWKLQ